MDEIKAKVGKALSDTERIEIVRKAIKLNKDFKRKEVAKENTRRNQHHISLIIDAGIFQRLRRKGWKLRLNKELVNEYQNLI